MIRIREASDLHLEHHYEMFDSVGLAATNKTLEILPVLPEDTETVLIVPGDIATIRRTSRIITFLKLVLPRFKHVIYVFGNHEHYGVVMEDSMRILQDAISEQLPDVSNLTVAGNEPVLLELEGIRFLCGTMWTDYGQSSDNAYEINYNITNYITDHTLIVKPDRTRCYPADMAKIFHATIEKFGQWLEGRDNSDTVIVTHHLPSYSAIHPLFLNGDHLTATLNYAFASDLDSFILKYKPAIWFFGHTHYPYHGTVGNTVLFCNPLGYPKEANFASSRFDPQATFTL